MTAPARHSPKTTFSGPSPFESMSTEKPSQAQAKKPNPSVFLRVNVSALTVEDKPYDPYWKTKRGESAYEEIFSKLKLGQCVACQPGECGAVASAMASWFRRRGQKILTRQINKDPVDGKGRVWLYKILNATPEVGAGPATAKVKSKGAAA